MERKIITPEIKSFDHWPYSYEWMVSDLYKAADAGANYLVALGLFCYSEAIGRDILRFRDRDLSPKYRPNKECFELFVREYMHYGELLDEHPDLYDTYRNGLSHDYFIKKDSPNGRSGVYLYYSDEPSERDKMEVQGIDLQRGIAISGDGTKRVFVIEPYLNDFVSGLQKVVEEMWEQEWWPDAK